MQTLAEQIKELESYIPKAAHTADTISKTTVGWQIEHTLKVVSSIVKALSVSKPQDYQPKMSIIKTAIMTTKLMPRGKAQAPKIVLPASDCPTEEELQVALGEVLEALNVLPRLAPGVHFKHPIFGSLQKKATEKFLRIHTEHHLKIIRDMLK